MENVIDVYLRPYDASKPVVCIDESSKQQIQELLDELPMKPGEVAKFESEFDFSVR